MSDSGGFLELGFDNSVLKAWPSQERENEKTAFRDVAGSISQAVKWRYITKNAEQLNAN